LPGQIMEFVSVNWHKQFPHGVMLWMLVKEYLNIKILF